MSETKLYYLGTGTEFIKAQCKEYKTIEGALKAAAKDESLVVWDADGNVIGSLTDNDEEQAAGTGDTAGGSNAGASEEEPQNPPQDSTQQDGDGQNNAGGTNMQANDESGQNGANTEPQDNDDGAGASGEDDEEQAAGQQDESKEEIGRFRVEVICEGSLRLRRSATFAIDNECGRASKGQTYIGKRIFMSDGLPMVETIDGLFLSAAAEHVKIERA